MEKQERLTPFTPEERAELESLKIEDFRGCIWVLGFLAAIVVLGLLATLYLDALNGLMSKATLAGLTIGFIVLSLIVMHYAVKAWGQPSEKSDVAKDLSGGVKKVITEPITAKNIGGEEAKDVRYGANPLNSYRRQARALNKVPEVEILYLITFGGKQYEIPSELYYKLNLGQAIDIHLAPNSGQIFSYRVNENDEVIPEIKEYIEK